MTRKTQLGWMAAGAVLGFATVFFGPKLFDRAKAQAGPEKNLTADNSDPAFQQVVQAWSQPKKEDAPPSGPKDPHAPQADAKEVRTDDPPPPPPAENVEKDISQPAERVAPPVEIPDQRSVPTPSDDGNDRNTIPPVRLKPSEEGNLPKADPDVIQAGSKRQEDSPAPPAVSVDLDDPPPPLRESADSRKVDPKKGRAPAPLPPDTDLARDVPIEKQTPEKTPSPLDPLVVQPVSIKPPPLRKPLPGAKLKGLPLTGTHPTAMDDRKSLVLPRSVRDQLGEAEVLFITPGADHSLWLTTAPGLEKLTDKLERKSEAGEEGLASRRRYFSQTERVAVNKAGRLIVPDALAQSAELKKDLVIIGVGDHVELWDAKRWEMYCQGLTEAETGTAEEQKEN